jgi:hypothetical protein
MGQRHDGNQTAYVQTGSGGIKADITGNFVCRKKLFYESFISYLLYKAPFL